MDLISAEELRALTGRRDRLCVSIFMPAHRLGPETRQQPIMLKNLLREAEEQLVAVGMRRTEAETQMKPAVELLDDALFWQYQEEGLALFLSTDGLRYYRLPIKVAELVIVADRFHLKPLLPLLSGDGKFYLLALSQNEIRLLLGTRHSVNEVELENVPQSLADALRYDDPEKQLQFHTGTPGGPGRRAAIFHGQGVGTDDSKDSLLRYFQQVDRGLRDVLKEERSPLLLAGVDYLLPIYRQANSHPYLLEEGLTGNPEELSKEALHQQAWALVKPRFRRDQKEASTRYGQLAGTGRASSRVEEIVPAAHYGRVETLFVAAGLQRWGIFDAETGTAHLHAEPEPGDEDLLDLAAIDSFLNGGTVYAVEPEEIPEKGAPVAALFRY